MDWFRWWHGTVTDPKFQWVSRRCGFPLSSVLAVWACLLECASTATQCNADATRGNVATFDCNDFDVLLGFDDGTTMKILSAMIDKNLVANGRVVGWEGRQPKREDSGNPNTGALSSTERSRAHRENKKREETQRNEMQRSATHGNDRLDKSREEEPKSKAVARGSRLPKGWLPSDDDLDFIRKERPELDASSIAGQFRDYWIAKAGKDGVKTDWPATWRNWVRNQRVKYSGGGGGGLNFHDDRKRVMDELTGRNRHVSSDEFNIIDI
jgi:hypothetical protein